ncbi:MAG: LPS export ABC transporter periplasmic protein LptC [Syntrophobacterales bacterium]|nr:LPS export ABC transporter periplasmic protein LptC [Syntrophobacterales bacterium]
MLKKISTKKLLIAGCVLLVGALSLYALRIAHKEKKDVLKVISERVDLRIKDFHYTEVGDPDLVWEINAGSARYVKKNDIARFENVKIRLVFSNGGIYTITGEKGSLHTDTKDMNIYGNVVAVSNSGDRFETGSLYYIHNNKRIYTKDTVEMMRPGADIKGVGMILSLKDRRATLLSNVSAVIKKK